MKRKKVHKMLAIFFTSALAVTTLLPQGSGWTVTSLGSSITTNGQANDVGAPNAPVTSPQDFTNLPFMEVCYGPITYGDLTDNGLKGWFCEEYLEDVIEQAQSILISPILIDSYPIYSIYAVLKTLDDDLNQRMASYHYDSQCDSRTKRYQACADTFKPCEPTVGDLYEMTPTCRATCRRLNACLFEDCSKHPRFDESNTTACFRWLEFDEGSTPSSSIAVGAASLLALAF